MTYNFTEAPAQIVLDLINADNGTTLTTSDVTFGQPTPIPGDRNTQVVLTSINAPKYSGSAVVTYNRISLEDVPCTRTTSFVVGNATHIADLISEINSTYEIDLTTEDYIDALLPTFQPTIPNQSAPFDLVAGVYSLVYIDRVTLTLVNNPIPLSSVITMTELSGLVYTPPS